MGIPRILSRAESAELLAHRMKAKRDSMTPQEIGALVRKVAHEALDKNGVVDARDFQLANVPDEAIRARGRAIIMEVVEERKSGGITA